MIFSVSLFEYGIVSQMITCYFQPERKKKASYRNRKNNIARKSSRANGSDKDFSSAKYLPCEK